MYNEFFHIADTACIYCIRYNICHNVKFHVTRGSQTLIKTTLANKTNVMTGNRTRCASHSHYPYSTVQYLCMK